MACGVLFQLQKDVFPGLLLLLGFSGDIGDLGGNNFLAIFLIDVDRLGNDDDEGALALTSTRKSVGFVEGISS